MWTKEQRQQWQRNYYQKRKTEPDYIKQKKDNAKRYYQSHKKECSARRKAYFESHKEQYRKYRREYRYNNPVGIYSVIKDGLNSKGNKRSILLKISKNDFVKWYNSQEKICHYCKRTFEQTLDDSLNNKVHRFTIDRIDNKKGYEDGNLALSCYRCNAIKNNYFTENEMMMIGKIINEKSIGLKRKGSRIEHNL